MCAVVAPEKRGRLHGGVPQNGRVLATVIGEVTDGDRLRITWHGQTVVDVPPRTVGPRRPGVPAPGWPAPDSQDALNADRSTSLPRPGHRCRAARHFCLRCLVARTCAAALSSPSSTTGMCAATPCWPSTPTAACCASTSRPTAVIALSTDASGRYTKLDPYVGAQLALAEALPQRRRHRCSAGSR